MGPIPQYQQNYDPGYGKQEAATSTNVKEQVVGQGHLYFPNESEAAQSSEHQPMLPAAHAQYGGAHFDPITVHSIQDDDPDYVEPKHHHNHRDGHGHQCCCTCLCQCIQQWKNAESLRRSVCYGAIDGMLTGSGILAAFIGMGILSSNSSASLHLFVVAFSLAACTSDAICMALGHVWSTYVLTSASANERRLERISFEKNQAESKGKLVDMLLSRGMLKIDAMSIADTLEGYPDIFVSALVGDSAYALGEDSQTSSLSSGGLGYQQGYSHRDDGAVNPLGGGGILAARGGGGAGRSYRQFNEWEHDPEYETVQVALGESRTEGLVMMFGFALFSVLPSLIFLWLSKVMDTTNQSHSSGSTSVQSIALSLTSLVMILLGIWKSKFFDSNWMVFGIETVVVLWLCILSAYSIGAGLVELLPSLKGHIQIKDFN